MALLVQESLVEKLLKSKRTGTTSQYNSPYNRMLTHFLIRKYNNTFNLEINVSLIVDLKLGKKASLGNSQG